MDTGYIHQLAEQIHQAGIDEMAEALATWIETIGTEDQQYRDGASDALLTLIHHGATDPR